MTLALQVAIAYADLVVIGFATGLLGVAWPSIRVTFGLSLDAVGPLMLVATLGSITGSFNGGRVISAIGMGSFLVVSSVLAGMGLLGYSLAPAWGVMVLVGLIYGIGSGSTHAALNAYFAANHSAGMMNWLHACFGLGSTLGPLLMTTILRAGYSWRWGYGIAGLCLVLLSIAFVLTRDRWPGFQEREAASEGQSSSAAPRHHPSFETLKLPIVWLNVLLFFAYTGIEVTGGQWAYSLFTEARGVAASVAGLWNSVYWGAFTGGRLLLGVVVDRLRVTTLIRFGIVGIIVGSGLLWWHPAHWVGFLGLALIGLAEAPIFPTLISVTPSRVGVGHADNAIGFQVAAAGLGGAGLSSLAGVLAEHLGLEIVGPFLLLFALVAFITHEAVVRWDGS